MLCVFFFFNDTATTEIYTLSLHDALPIYLGLVAGLGEGLEAVLHQLADAAAEHRLLAEEVGLALLGERGPDRSEEHTSELQSRQYLVCRLLLEKKKQLYISSITPPIIYSI